MFLKQLLSMSYSLSALKKIIKVAGPNGFFATVVTAGILGFILGSFYYPTWQEVVEYGQVVINKIPYPQETPFYRIQSSIWSLPSQLAGLVLFLGVAEKTLSVIVSGILGMISFQAISLVVFAISRQAVFSIAATVFIFLTRAVEFGVIYPVWLLGYPHTNG